ncbi:MAG TPA: hypothetical protein PKD54_12270, partial [Pirellulaceae bacterium]|nr:hypothetical protein [Pirellulaceae bacterium]
MQNRLFSIHVWPLTCFVTLMVCGLCSCDTSIKKRASTTQGMSWEQLTRAGGDAPPLAEIRSGAPFEYCDPPRIETGMMDALGRPVTVSCASCHGNLPPDPHRSSADELREFHSGLTYNHGGEQPLSCLSCHRAENYNQLRLVDGRPLEFYQSR